MSTKNEALELLQKENLGCTACPLASQGRSSIVFGTGRAESALFFVGEAPGAEEDKTGTPFMGKAGQLLRTTLQTIIPLETSYFLSNAVKCRPPKNRTPFASEISCCTNKTLFKEISIVKPQLIIALGKSAFFALTKEKISLSQARNTLYFFQEIPVVVTFHPAFCLRFPKWLPEFKKDLQSALKTNHF